MTYNDRLAAYMLRTRETVARELETVLADLERGGRGAEPLAAGIRQVLAEWRASADGEAEGAASAGAA